MSLDNVGVPQIDERHPRLSGAGGRLRLHEQVPEHAQRVLQGQAA